ncbi:hypothetical protein Golomagni_00114 [Golovinomyces magnicellulatus]|nr:hypothetical protein Golomagni_00114 [Golovinomyces magnicellulatus]
MSGNKLNYGLNIKKDAVGNRVRPALRKPLFDQDLDDEVDIPEAEVEEVYEIGGFETNSNIPVRSTDQVPPYQKREKQSIRKDPNKTLSFSGNDLSSSLTSKKHENAAKDLDINIYEYDAVYDSLKQTKKKSQDDKSRKPRYMASLIAAAAVRKRDATIAEEKKLAREREAEGDEFTDKERFVTSAYKKQQEENHRFELEEKKREELDAKKNMNTGMLSFYKNILEKNDNRHAEILKAVDEQVKNGPDQDVQPEREKTAAEIAKEINGIRAGAIIVNDEGDVVDKRQLLAGGLNIVSKPNKNNEKNTRFDRVGSSNNRNPALVGANGLGGAKKAMRERQSRMIEAQIEQVSKRALEQEEEENLRMERLLKSRKTQSEIMDAKARYLARKRESEKAKGKNT